MPSNQLSGAKLALLEKRLGRTFSDVGVTSRIPRRPQKERAPLSIQQQSRHTRRDAKVIKSRPNL